MYKSRSDVFPRSTCLGLTILCLVLLSELTAAKSFAQEAQNQQEDWTLSFRANNDLRERDNEAHRAHQIENTEPLPPDARQEYVREYGSIIDEGIESLKHAIGLRPDYDDAMAYLNLLYRRKADTVDYQNERDELLKMADDLVDRVKEIKEKRAQVPTQP